MNIFNFLISLLLGMFPEVLFFTMYLIYTKNIKEKRLKLFLLISIAYILCVMIIRHQVIYYIVFLFLIYLILKILYKKKTQIIDIFIINISFAYVALISSICFSFVNNNYILYYIMLVINRVLLFLPFIFKKKFNYLYKIYCNLWNRTTDKNRPIKSITLRNISLILLNSLIFLINLATISIINSL